MVLFYNTFPVAHKVNDLNLKTIPDTLFSGISLSLTYWKFIFLNRVILSLLAGNANRGVVGYFEIPPSEKFPENTPSIFFEKQGKRRKLV